MIKLRKNMGFNEDGTIIRNFLEGRLIYNEKTNDIGIIKAFHITTEENSSAQEARFFRVIKASTGTPTNWFIDLKDGLNKKLHLLPEEVNIKNLL